VNVVGKDAIAKLKDGAILANAGHFNDEIDLVALGALAECTHELRPLVHEYKLRDGRSVVVLAEGRLVNLAAAEGHPPAVMDMSFANQALSVEHLERSAGTLERRVYAVPRELDEQIARSKLEAMGMRIDAMTEEQRAYANSWKAGT
jgi:adenosylhomocysteinase